MQGEHTFPPTVIDKLSAGQAEIARNVTVLGDDGEHLSLQQPVDKDPSQKVSRTLVPRLANQPNVFEVGRYRQSGRLSFPEFCHRPLDRNDQPGQRGWPPYRKDQTRQGHPLANYGLT